jgi:hypothetical protein
MLNREGHRDIRAELAKMVKKGFASVIRDTRRRIIGWELREDDTDYIHESLCHILMYHYGLTITPHHPAS